MLTHDQLLDKMAELSNDLNNLNRELGRKNKKAESEIKELRGIIPICVYCRQIRDDDGYWDHLEEFMGKYSSAELSHGICPACYKKHFSHFNKE